MRASPNKLTIKIAIVDVLLLSCIPVLLFAFEIASAKHEVEFLKSVFFRAMLLHVFPLAAFVGWRGKLDAERRLNGRGSFFRPMAEGFVCGFVLLIGLSCVNLASAALAAGTIEDGVVAQAENPAVWLWYLGFVVVWGMIVGCVGAVIGLSLGAVNHVLLKMAGAI